MDGELKADARLTGLTAGMPIVYGGDRIAHVGPALAEAFQPGDRLLVDPDSGALLHVPAAEHAVATGAVGSLAWNSCGSMGSSSMVPA